MRQHLIPADELLHLAAEFVEHSGELARDVAAADDRDPLRPPLQREEAVGGDSEVGARQLGHDGHAAGGDHDVRRGQARLAGLDGAPVEEPGAAAHQGDALRRQIARIDAVEALDVRIALGLQRRPVAAAGLHVETVVARIAEGERDARGVPHDLLRHAADVDAGPAQPVRFDDRRLGAVLGGALRAGEAAAAAADDDEIEQLIRHCELRQQGSADPDDILNR